MPTFVKFEDSEALDQRYAKLGSSSLEMIGFRKDNSMNLFFTEKGS